MKQKTITVNFIFNMIKSIMVVIFPLISFPYISRVLGVEGLGKYQYCVSVISYFVLFSSLGINTYSIREGAKLRNNKEKFSQFVLEIFTINMITTILSYLVLLIFFLVGAFQGKREIMLLYSLMIIGNTLCIDWLFQAVEEYVYISIRTILIQAISLILMFAFVKKESDILIYTLITVFSSKGYCFFNIYQSRKYVDFRFRYNLELVKHLKPIFVIFGATLAVSIYMNMDVVMLEYFSGDYQVGLYSAAVKVNVVAKNVITSIGAVFLPRLVSYLAKGQREEYEKLFRQGTEVNLLLSVACTAGLSVLASPIIEAFSGAEFLPAVFTSKILSIRLVFSALDNIFYNQVLIPTGNEKKAFIGTTAGAVSNLILNAFLIPLFQEEGAAVATVISEGVVFIYFICTTRKIIDLKLVVNGIPKYIIAAGVMWIVIAQGMKMINSYLLQLVILIPIGAAIYFAVLVCLIFMKRLRSCGHSKGA